MLRHFLKLLGLTAISLVVGAVLWGQSQTRGLVENSEKLTKNEVEKQFLALSEVLREDLTRAETGAAVLLSYDFEADAIKSTPAWDKKNWNSPQEARSFEKAFVRQAREISQEILKNRDKKSVYYRSIQQPDSFEEWLVKVTPAGAKLFDVAEVFKSIPLFQTSSSPSPSSSKMASRVYLVNSSGVVVQHSQSAYRGTLAPEGVRKWVKNPSTGIYRFKSLDGLPVLAKMARVPGDDQGLPFGVIIEKVARNEVPFWAEISASLLVGILGLVFFAGTWITFYRRKTAPVLEALDLPKGIEVKIELEPHPNSLIQNAEGEGDQSNGNKADEGFSTQKLIHTIDSLAQNRAQEVLKKLRERKAKDQSVLLKAQAPVSRLGSAGLERIQSKLSTLGAAKSAPEYSYKLTDLAHSISGSLVLFFKLDVQTGSAQLFSFAGFDPAKRPRAMGFRIPPALIEQLWLEPKNQPSRLLEHFSPLTQLLQTKLSPKVSRHAKAWYISHKVTGIMVLLNLPLDTRLGVELAGQLEQVFNSHGETS